jgi:hypothetical protein
MALYAETLLKGSKNYEVLVAIAENRIEDALQHLKTNVPEEKRTWLGIFKRNVPVPDVSLIHETTRARRICDLFDEKGVVRDPDRYTTPINCGSNSALICTGLIAWYLMDQGVPPRAKFAQGGAGVGQPGYDTAAVVR